MLELNKVKKSYLVGENQEQVLKSIIKGNTFFNI